ncbi:leucine-rich_repeat domain-containing protein [Hexamita inflata]|uniref:Leucine-rich_repeat domain-containing protein n=1 Tax=Hexamita inflata TaxID=28002 RepID=A0ABP1L0Y2_9EUKA
MSETACFVIKQKSDLKDTNIQRHTNINITDTHCKYLRRLPVHIQILTMNNCALSEISQLCNLSKLTHLDVSHNHIADISQIVYNLELVHFDVSNNFVIKVEPVLELKNLETLVIAGNMIKNLEPLVHHANFSEAWIQPQIEFTERNVYNTLTPGSSEEKVREFALKENQKQEYSDYVTKFVKELAPLVKQKQLVIKDNARLKDFGFVDCFDVATLVIENCPNVTFESLPKKVKHLSATKSGLTSIDGIAKMTWLESLDVSDNLLLKCQPLSNLKLLKKVVMSGNKIIDLKHVHELPLLDWAQSKLEQNPAEPSDFQKHSNADELAKEAKLNAESNQNVIYDSCMSRKYHAQAKNGALAIVNDEKLTSVCFSELIGVESLFVVQCVNISFQRCPTKVLKKLTANCCNIRSLDGLQKMTQLTELTLSLNQISNTEVIASLVNLTSLDMSQNNLEDISPIAKLKQLKVLDLSQNLITSIKPLQGLDRLEILTLVQSNLTDISSLSGLAQLTELDVSQNNIANINSVAKMVNLTYLNFSFNKVISLEALEHLKNVQDLRMQNNFIQDFEPITKLPHANKSWISSQLVPTQQDFLNSFNCNEMQLQQVLKKAEARKKQSDNKFTLVKKYQDAVVNDKLKIENENKLFSLAFADFLKITDLEATQCQTIGFEEHSKTITKLKLNKCTFSQNDKITDIYNMTQLIELDLGFNAIENISELSALVNVKRLNLQNNAISRIGALRDLKLTHLNLGSNRVIFSDPVKSMKAEVHLENNLIVDADLKNQGVPAQGDFKYLLGPNSTQEQAKELFESTSYQSQMVKLFQNQVNNNQLLIKDDQQLKDFQFVADFKLNALAVDNCKNVRLSRKFAFKHLEVDKFEETKLVQAPLNITVLRISNCGLTNLLGLEDMVQLVELDARDNTLVSIEPIKYLVNLKTIWLENNYVIDLEHLLQLDNYTTDWICEQSDPTDELFKKYLLDTQYNIELSEFKKLIQKQVAKTKELIEQFGSPYKQQMVEKYQKQIINDSLKCENDETIEDFNFTDRMNVNKLEVNNCFNVTFVKTPVKITHLTVSNSKLVNITGIKQMTQLIYLSLANNQIIIVQELQYLVNLKNLDLSNNSVADLQFITNLPNFSQEWICSQNNPTDETIIRYLKDSNSDLNLQQFKAQILPLQKKTLEMVQIKYDNELKSKYQHQIVNFKLTVNGDNNLREIKFAENLDIVNLEVYQCVNVNFKRVPGNIKSLTVMNCGLITIDGIQDMKQLLFVDLRENEIVSIQQLRELINLKHVLIDDNHITDLEVLQQLPNFDSIWIQEQKPRSDAAYQNYLIKTASNMSLEQFKASIVQKLQKTEELLNQYPRKYDAEITAKYQGQIQANVYNQYGRGIYVHQNDPLIRDLKPFQKFNCECLFFLYCENVTLLRVPETLKVIQVYQAKLKSVKGVEFAAGLEQVYLQANDIVNIEYLRGLKKVTHLYIPDNKIREFAAVQGNKDNGQYASGYSIEDQKQPTQQEIEESRLW